MKISACLIVKNETTEIIGCLDSLLDVDEIVIVDTGSEDDTVKLIWQWKTVHPDISLVVGFFQWIDDFSAARNYAASLASGDWLLSIDADERLGEGSVDALRLSLADGKGRTRRCLVKSMRGNSEHFFPRIYKRNAGISWKNPIHNLLSPEDGGIAPGVVINYGYSVSHKLDPDRTLRILHAEAERNETSRTCFYLGHTYFERRKYDEALTWLRRCTAKSSWAPERADAYLTMAKILWQQRKGDEARKCCLYSLGNAPDCREALFFMATMSFPEQAKSWRKFAETATNSGILFNRT